MVSNLIPILNARYRCCDIQKCLKHNDVLHNSVISFCLENEVKIGPFNEIEFLSTVLEYDHRTNRNNIAIR